MIFAPQDVSFLEQGCEIVKASSTQGVRVDDDRTSATGLRKQHLKFDLLMVQQGQTENLKDKAETCVCLKAQCFEPALILIATHGRILRY